MRDDSTARTDSVDRRASEGTAFVVLGVETAARGSQPGMVSGDWLAVLTDGTRIECANDAPNPYNEGSGTQFVSVACEVPLDAASISLGLESNQCANDCIEVDFVVAVSTEQLGQLSQ